MKVRALGLSASALALTFACNHPASAQAAAPAAQPGTVEELVVTAERRASNLQTTPIAATVLTGADLVKKGVVTVDQLQTIMPSVTIQNFGQGNDFNIRGIGKGEQNSGTTVGVITYRDGVATFPGYFQDEPYYDIASVEVLRGPQGTFAGQNATGGAVFITEVNPTLGGGYHGYLQAQGGTYGDVGLQGATDIPISDTLEARIAFNTEHRDSFYHITGPFSGHPGRLDEANARFSLLWQPSDALKVLWKTDYNYIDQGGYPADPVLATNDPFHITSNAHNLAVDQFVRSVLNVNYVLPDGITFRSISGYQSGRSAFDGDVDGTSLANYTLRDGVDEVIYSQEFNLLSREKGFFTWVLGAYYQHDKHIFPAGQFDIGLPAGVFDDDLSGTNPAQTVAGFGQGDFNFDHGLQLQIGLRYSASQASNHGVISVPELGEFLPDNQTEKDSKLTGKIALNWTLDPNNFLYAFVATGYKPGGLNTPASFSLPPTFGPESVTDYEIGWKATALDGHVKTQLGAYYNDYKNFQVTFATPDNPTTSLELNDPSKTTIYGLEAQAQAIFGSLSFDGGLSLLHSRLGTFFATDPRTGGVALCDPLTGPVSSTCENLTGHQQDYAPRFTFNLGGQYVFDLANGATLTPRINFGHIDSQWATLFENAALGDRLGERNLLSAQLSYQLHDLLVALYGTNLTDQHYVTAVNSGLRYEGAPRQVGLRITRNF
ncbi:TonB-dependent receptor [Phenylobacterium sp.]|uniref:TonB-dependent receptor n=1 Tax=Phenylobacterium sp. TaxID=1871053 RepID=UPI0012038247|nr:TonB-dependent receptor [Phenylobacterium sp.]THD61272.1 MAG: TonB-dependent receptor [Phenylobacterium sp.]